MTKIALCGNPNSGKTTILNALTGLNLHTGNYNGVTVSAYEARLTNDITVCDLPGIFTFKPDTRDEISACEYLKKSADKAVIIADGCYIEKIAPIASSLAEMKLPCAAVVTMADLLKRDGGKIDADKLEKTLGIPVFISDRKKFDALRDFILSAEYRTVRDCSPAELKSCVVGERRYGLCAFDRLLFSGGVGFLLPIILILPIIFIYSCISPLLTEVVGYFLELLKNFAVSRLGASPFWLRHFISEAVFGGALTVLEFVPSVVLTIAYLTFLEESGIAPRLCAVMSPFAESIGISPTAVSAFLLGFGCTVPAVDALRAVDNKSALRASYILPFFQCSAKIPVFYLFTSVFFHGIPILTLFLIYLGGVLVAFAVGYIFKLTSRSEPVCGVIELPRYRRPALRDIVRNSADKCGELTKKIVTVLLILSSVVWLLCHLTPSLEFVGEDRYAESLLYTIGGMLAPIFAPLGFDSGIAAASLVSGIFAKEGVLTSLAVCAGRDGVRFIAQEVFSIPSAVSFLTFFALYPPCVTAFFTYSEEFGIYHAVKCALVQFAASYFLSFVVYRFALIAL